jgi:hypothetical protein
LLFVSGSSGRTDRMLSKSSAKPPEFLKRA